MFGHALRLSLIVATLATVAVAIVGTAIGWWLARTRFRGRAWVDALLMLPLVLPPTVTGYYLIVLFGREGWIGGSLPFTTAACVVAAAVISFPLMVRAARSAFEAVDPAQLTAAASLGAAPLAVFFRIALPLASRGLAAGVMLTFARALGEFGATLMLAGNIPGRTQTLPLALYEAVMLGEDQRAAALSLILTLVSVAALVALSKWTERSR